MRVLPASPSLDHLKRQAKDLKKACDRGDAESLRRVRALRLASLAQGPVALATAQLAIAREYGFASWPKLKARVDASGSIAKAVDAFLAAAGEPSKAREILKAQPEIPRASLAAAAMLGEEEIVEAMLAGDASLAKQKSGEPKREPLHWVCHATFHRGDAARARRILACAKRLIAAGGDPNAFDIFREANQDHRIPALYGAGCVAKFPKLARLLLESGAAPTDGETAYHAAAEGDTGILELLEEFGVDLNSPGTWGNVPLYFVLGYKNHERGADRADRGVRWLLQHGADPNVLCNTPKETPLHWAVRRGRRPEIVKLLLKHGADVTIRRGDGRTPWSCAMRAGHPELAKILEKHGAKPEALTPADELLGACGSGDAAMARRLASPEIVRTLTPEDLQLLPDAASDGRRATVQACLAAGFPVDALGDFHATALQHASLRGYADIVRDILPHKPDLEIRDPEHNGNALGWAIFGAFARHTPDGDWAGCVEALLEAGAKPQHPNYRTADRRVAAVLKKWRLLDESRS